MLDERTHNSDLSSAARGCLGVLLWPLAALAVLLLAAPALAQTRGIDEMLPSTAIGWEGRSQITSPSNGAIRLRANNGTSGVALDVGADGSVSFADANGDFAATTLGGAIEELVSSNGSGPNAATGKVHWSQIVGMPAGFADGTDDGASGGSGTLTTVKGNGTQVGGADIVTLDFSSDFGVAESPDTEINVTIDASIARDSEVTAAVSALSSVYQPLDSDLTTWAGVTSSANGRSLVIAADYSAMRTLLSLVPGTNVQTQDAFLQDIADLADPNASRVLKWNDSTNEIEWAVDATGGGGGDVDDFATDPTSNANFVPSTWVSELGLDGLYQPLDSDLTDLADGTLTGSKVSGAVTVSGGTVNNSVIGGTTPAAITGTTITATTSVTTVDDAYNSGAWDGNNTVPTKNAVRDQIQAMLAGGGLGTGDIDTSAEIASIVGDETGSGALVFGTSPTLTTPTLSGAITASGTSLTGSQATSTINATATWNTTGTPMAIMFDVTDTASNGASQLLELRRNSSRVFAVGKFGGVYIADGNTGMNMAGTQYRTPAVGTYQIMNQASPNTAVKFWVTNKRTSDSDYEVGSLAWISDDFYVGTERGGSGGSAQDTTIGTDGTRRWLVGASNGHLVPFADSTYDAGASGNEIRGVYADTVTAGALAGGAWTKLQKKTRTFVLFGATTDAATGDGAAYYPIPPELNGANITYVHLWAVTAGTTGTSDVQIARVRSGSPVDVLSTKVTIDSTEQGSDTAAAAAVINTSNDDVATNDILRVDVDALSTTKPKGLIVTIGFELQ